MDNNPKDLEALQALHQKYLAQLPEQVQEIRRLWTEAIESDAAATARDALYTLVHRLHGSAGTYGLNTISEHLRPFDEFLRNLKEQGGTVSPEDRERFAALIDRLHEEVEAVVATPPAPAMTPEQDPRLLRLARPYHILLVEDSNLLRRRLALALEENGLIVEEAADGMEALEKARHKKPDLVLLDVMMPGMDGYEVISRFKSEADFCAIPIIMLTARSTVEDVKRAIAMGVKDYLVKPVDPYEVVRHVLMALTGYDPEQEEAPVSLAPARILVVEDSAILRKLFARILAEGGYEVEEAENGQQALEKMRAQRPDLVVMDVMMPVMDGLEALRQMRRDEMLRSLPVIMLTAKNTVEAVQQASLLHIEDYIVKPAHGEKLLGRVRDCLEKLGRVERKQGVSPAPGSGVTQGEGTSEAAGSEEAGTEEANEKEAA
ncbi:MAG: hypothetical protein KatS3mg044_0548 [Rhodothermaceae bacterium]|nr:MAG: hypothetical protein KatS3mg044_0548 [Rhodothermaceae bacterium]